jgi:hypothetical protein
MGVVLGMVGDRCHEEDVFLDLRNTIGTYAADLAIDRQVGAFEA